jgi:hypothetical protein
VLHLILLCLPFFFVGQFWKDIWNGMRGAADRIGDMVDAVWNAIAGALWERIGHLMQTIWNSGDHILSGLWNRLGDLAQTVWNAGDHVFGALSWCLGNLGNVLRDAVGAAKDAGVWAIGNLGNILRDAVGAAKDAGVWAIGNLGNILRDAVGAAKDAGVWALGNLGNILHDAVGGLADKLWDRLGDLLGGVRDVGEKVEGIPEAAFKLALDHKDEILKAYLLGFPDAVILSLPELFDRFGSDVVKALHVGGKGLEQFAGDVFDAILTTMVGTGRIEPEEASDRIARALGVATAFGVAAQVPGLVQGLIPTENPTATNYVAGFLGKFSGWDHLIEAGLGAAVALALRRPMEYHLNKRSLTNEPRPGDLTDLYGRRFIDAATFDETMHRHGFPDDWGAPMREAAYKPLKKFELKMIAESTNLPENVLTFFLENAGYRPEAVPLMIKALQDTALKTARSGWLTQARAAYADGFIDLPAFRSVMDALGIDPSEQDLWVMSAESAYVNAVKTEMLSAFRSAAARDAMVDDELRAALSQLGMTSDKIEVEVARANVARLKKPVDEVAAEQKAAVNTARADMIQAYSLQFRKGAIDEQTFLAALTFIGVPEVQARAVVALAKAQSLEVPKAAPVDTPEMAARRTVRDLQDAYVLQFQHDLIDAETLYAALEGTGMAPYEASAIVLREQAKKTPSPVVANVRTEERVTMEVQQSLATAYAQQYQQGFITADELEADLVAAGFDPRVAHSRRLLEESRAYGLATKSRDSTEAQAAAQLERADQTVAVEAFRKGVITADQLEAALVDIGLSPELAHAVRQYEELFALPNPPAAPASP